MAYLTYYIFLLMSYEVARIFAVEYCYTSNGYYTGYCYDDEDCCNNGYNCCEKTEHVSGGDIAGIVVGAIILAVIVAIIFICVKKHKRTPVRTVHPGPVIHTTTVQQSNTHMFQHHPMGGPNPPMGGPHYPMGGPHHPMGGPNPPMGGPYPPPYGGDPSYPPSAY